MNLVNVKPGFVRTSQMDKFFDDFFQANREVKPASYRPAANIINQEKAYVIELLIPGIDKKELNIALEKDILTIKANREETNGEDIRYTTKEFNIRNFERKFKLSDKVEKDSIEAKLENGILRLFIPKAAEVYTKHQIEVA